MDITSSEVMLLIGSLRLIFSVVNGFLLWRRQPPSKG